MPILLNDLQNTAPVVKTYSPKFFDSKLTGKGGTSAGLLSARNNPLSIDPTVTTSPSDYETYRRNYRAGQTTLNRIPMNPLTTQSLRYMDSVERPDLKDLVKIGTQKNVELYMNMKAQTISIEETTVPDPWGGPSQTKRVFTASYIITLYYVQDSTKTTHAQTNMLHVRPTRNYYINIFLTNPLQEMQFDIAQQLKSNGWTIDNQAIVDYIVNYDLYDAVCERSEEWQTYIDKTLDSFFTNIHDHYANDSTAMHYVEDQVKYIMSYNIPLDLYKSIYASIAKNFGATDARRICKQNLNLLLSDTLSNLNAHKTQINGFTPTTQLANLPSSIKRLSNEQKKAVMSTEPLILVQAGAGTGKSTLILGRIDYLVDSGVAPEDITVLSFTNAAADHITDKNPNVHSMTIARMIHEIYTANFQNHELSSLDTIINSIDIYFPPTPGVSTPNGINRNIVDQFQRKLKAMVKNDTNNFTEMNNFIEENYDDVMAILDTISQTSLELEIIICYQKIDTFVEPASIASKFLIIDEVQDNSIFEFVYTLKYVDKHKESLFIVGDCSQTLYEFRASNPRALNILEGSNTFATYQLNVNYRSNQEILDFANIALQNIEANQYAQIQLQANSLAQVTEQSFLDHVEFNYHQMMKITDFHQELPQIFSMEVRPYIERCLARNEQVAVLAFTRNDVAVIKQILENQYPGTTCVSLVPKKMYNTTVMSSFIKKYWNDIKFAPYQNIINIIHREIMARLTYLVYNDKQAAPRISQMLNDWAAQEGPKIQTWINQCKNGQLTETELRDLVMDNMIKYEISTNAIKQSLLAVENQLAKADGAADNADFVISTIHSAKGLEFQNVIVLYRNENQMEEDKKRMYYVALTRAMQSEYILAYDTMASPQIQADYVTVLEHLHAIAPAQNSPIDMLAAKRKRSKRIKI